MKSWHAKRCVVMSAITASYFIAGRPWQFNWGATENEQSAALTGDELIERADLIATRAISIQCSAEFVWPWIAQIGQGRGGMYSYDALENLIGCNIHSASHVVPEWQEIALGDEVRLAPQVALKVASIEQGRSLVLSGGVPLGKGAPPYDFTWSFVIQDDPNGSVRLLVRERYTYKRAWARLIVEPTEIVSFLMSQKMLRGIRDRAESLAGVAGIPE